MPLTEISQVIAKLDYIIHWSKEHNSTLGYFPALYQRTTIEVEKAIDHGFFDYPEFMIEMDVKFAEYYLRAFEKYMRKSPFLSNSWLFSFKQAEQQQISVIQHLLLGMNAHINLDLGITMAELTTPETIGRYKHDFYRINQILYSLVDQMQDMISQIWGPLKIIDFLLGRLDEKMVEWVLRKFRNDAWNFANNLVRAKSKNKQFKLMENTDTRVTQFGNKICLPKITTFNPFYYGIVAKENDKISQIIDILHHADIYAKW